MSDKLCPEGRLWMNGNADGCMTENLSLGHPLYFTEEEIGVDVKSIRKNPQHHRYRK